MGNSQDDLPSSPKRDRRSPTAFRPYLSSFKTTKGKHPGDRYVRVVRHSPDDFSRVGPNVLKANLEDDANRTLIGPLVTYIEELREQQPDSVLTVVLPEYVPSHWWEQVLHNQTALWIKAALLFKPGIVVTNVPYLAGPAPHSIMKVTLGFGLFITLSSNAIFTMYNSLRRPVHRRTCSEERRARSTNASE